jgi:hypothetical protein
VAAFDATTGVVDALWDPNVSNGTVFALAVSGGKVYVGGGFTRVNGIAVVRNRLAAFNVADGASPAVADPAWIPNPNAAVNAIAVSGGKVYVGGIFTSVNGGARNRLAAFNLADGSSAATVDPVWDPDVGHSVRALAVSGGKVYAGGWFTDVNGGLTTRNRLAAFNLADGSSAATADPAWDPNMDGLVLALAVSGGKVYAGGPFTTVNGGATSRWCLAAFNPADGVSAATVDSAWDPNLTSSVRALAVSGGKIFVGGDFTTANGGAIARNRLAAFNLADGSSAATPDSWDPSANDTVKALAPSGSGGILAGGDFTTIGGNPQLYLAAFGADSMMPLTWIPAASLMLVVGLLAVRRRKARAN